MMQYISSLNIHSSNLTIKNEKDIQDILDIMWRPKADRDVYLKSDDRSNFQSALRKYYKFTNSNEFRFIKNLDRKNDVDSDIKTILNGKIINENDKLYKIYDENIKYLEYHRQNVFIDFVSGS